MDISSILDLKRKITVSDCDTRSTLPGWALSLIWLGNWCRRIQFRDERLVVFVVLPTRELAAAFAAFGAILAGARSYADGLSWEKFRNKPIGSVVYWTERDGAKKFSGKILRFEKMHGTEVITIHVIKPATLAKKGCTTSIGRSQFDLYLFTEEAPPTNYKCSIYSRAEEFLRQILGDLSHRWMWADGAEALLVTQITEFERAVSGLSLSYDQTDGIFMLDLLCLAGTNEPTLAKLRISHPGGRLDGRFPLAILNGPDAFYAHEYLLGTANILTILDRSEYSEGINDSVLQISAIARSASKCEIDELSVDLPIGFELAAYLVKKG